MALKFTALSGTTSVNENLYVYEYKDEMMIVDCGIGFPDMEMHGVDLIIPDFMYVKENQDKLKGIIVSQGHEDHQGALGFLLKEIKPVTVHAPKLTAAFIKDNLEEHGLENSTNINVYDPEKDTIQIGPFTIHPFRVSHSVPDTLGFAIDTPEGRIFHVAEHKFDPNPVDGNPTQVQKASQLASEGVLFLASDCLGANKEGSVGPERPIEANMERVMRKAEGAIFFTTISSNIGRIQQALNVAQKLNRKVAFVGRSIMFKSEAANKLGYLKYKRKLVVGLKQAMKMNRSQVMFVIAGCYGQVGSSLFRVATNEHSRVWLEEKDQVVFSANPAPDYSKESQNFVVDNLYDLGAEVYYYDNSEGLYVSGHGGQEEIVRMFEIVNPKYFIPIGGTVRFMHAYEKLVEEFGSSKSNVFKLKPGESLIFEDGKVRMGGKIPVKEVYVDGLGIGDVGRIMLEDRKTLSENGVAIAIIKLDRAKNKLTENPDIISRGFVFQKEEKEFLNKSAKALRNKLERTGRLDRKRTKYLAVEFLADLFFKETGRRPLIVPVVVEV
jgi:ribonuclease J